MEIDVNPFIYGRALRATEFAGRRGELKKLWSRLATGQSVAIIGQPHAGKTSILKYLLDPGIRKSLTGTMFERDCFIFLDAQMLRGITTRADFWQLTTDRLEDHLRSYKFEGLQRLLALYLAAVDNQFGSFELEELLAGIGEADVRLVLLLDEFDDILAHPQLNSADFYGGLRALASHSGGLILIIATRLDIVELNRKTQEFTPTSSPYFNTFTQLELGSLSKEECQELLDRAGTILSSIDQDYIYRVSGRHPYLFQSTAASLWNAIREGKEREERYIDAGRELYRQSRNHFIDTWRIWSNATRKAITAIALSQIPQLLSQHEFHVSKLVDNLNDYSAELDTLKTVGMITKHEAGEWRITQEAFLWWLADELKLNVRDDSDFRNWLRAQEFDNLLTKNEEKNLNIAVKNILDLAGRGATTLIESLAKGFGEGLYKTLTRGGD